MLTFRWKILPKYQHLICDDFVERLRCVQCTSEEDENCESKTEATECGQFNHRFCATITSTALDLSTI